MPELNFEVENVTPHPYAASPLLNFRLRITNTTGEPIHSIFMRCQIMFEATRRQYNPEEQERLFDLFGEPELWDRSLRSLLWTNTNVVVSGFAGSMAIDMLVPCTFDFNVAATKYFAGLEGGEVPLLLLFSGTIFYKSESGLLQVTQISWEQEASYRLPVRVWREMMDTYYPNTVWLCLQRDAFDRLYRYKVRQAIPTFEQTLELVIPDEGVKEGPGDVEDSSVKPDEQETDQ